MTVETDTTAGGQTQTKPAGVGDVSAILEKSAEDRAKQQATDTKTDTSNEDDKTSNEEEEEDTISEEDENKGETDEEEECGEEEETDEQEEVDDDTIEVDPSHLAAMFGLNEGDVDVVNDQLAVKVKVDGEEEMVPLNRIRENYQLRKHIEKKGTELKSEKEQFQSEIQEKRQQLDGVYQQMTALVQSDMNALLDEYNRVDWDGLKQSDPARYAADYTDFQKRFQSLQNKHTSIAQEMQKQQEEAQKASKQQFETYVQQEADKVLEALPHWNDKDTAKEEANAIKEYALNEAGFTEQEVAKMIDHRIWVNLRKAMLYDKGIVNKDTKGKANNKRKVRVAKVSRSGARTSETTRNRRNLNKQKQAAKSGGPKEKLAFVSKLIK